MVRVPIFVCTIVKGLVGCIDKVLNNVVIKTTGQSSVEVDKGDGSSEEYVMLTDKKMVDPIG